MENLNAFLQHELISLLLICYGRRIASRPPGKPAWRQEGGIHGSSSCIHSFQLGDDILLGCIITF